MDQSGQDRVNAIHTFREELSRLVGEGVAIDPATLDRLRNHHDLILQRHNAGNQPAAARLSTGMRIATLLGTIALATAYSLFVSSHWGAMALTAQLALVILPAPILIGLTHVAMQREPSGYVAAILATVAVVAFAVNLGTLGSLFNLPDSRSPLLLVGLLGLILAYRFGLVLPLIPGMAGVAGWFWTLGAIPLGLWWRDGFGVVEPLILVSVAAMTLPARLPDPHIFARFWRLGGALTLVLALLVVEQAGQVSIFTSAEVHTIQLVYQMVGAVVFPGLIAWGIMRDERRVVVLGTVASTCFLFLRLVDWFWDWMPGWLFFLLVGACALGVLLLLRNLRQKMVMR